MSEIIDVGLRPITDFDAADATWPRGDRPAAIRAAAAAFKSRFTAAGTVRAVATVDLVSAPYPTKYAFAGAAIALNPFVNLVNRLVVVQYDGFDGVPRTLAWEPTLPEGSATAPFYADLASRLPERAASLLAPELCSVPAAIASLGLEMADIDVVAFDHLHVQDLHRVLGTSDGAFTPLFPNASMLAMRREVDTLRSTHPMQYSWYVPGGLDLVRTDRLVELDGGVELGAGVALVATPGHTDGNVSLVLNTPDGVWVSSENGVALDAWQPELSRIPGLRRYAASMRREVMLNSNTLEDSIDQYDSMVKEKALADPRHDAPEWLQILPSSELAPYRRQWPVVPTKLAGGLRYGAITRSLRTPASASA